MIRKYFLTVAIFCFSAMHGYSQFSEQSLKLVEVFDKISRYYVDTINDKSYIEKVIVQMLHELDPHSSYLSREEVQAMQEPLDGNFEGIGVSFNVLKDTIFIVNTIPGGPSERIGIKAGDRILKIDGLNVAGIGITSNDVMKKLKGKILIVVGAEKVPREVYELADHNVAVGNQPHSEIAALAVLLDRMADGKGLNRDFGGKMKIIPNPRGKTVETED